MRPLTPRQLQVVRTYVERRSTKETAAALGIAEATVKHTLAAARQKAGVETTFELAHAVLPGYGNIRCPDCGAAIAVRMEVAS